MIVHVNVVSVDAVTTDSSLIVLVIGKFKRIELPTGKLLGADVVNVQIEPDIFVPPVICHVLFVRLFTHRFEFAVEK